MAEGIARLLCAAVEVLRCGCGLWMRIVSMPLVARPSCRRLCNPSERYPFLLELWCLASVPIIRDLIVAWFLPFGSEYLFRPGAAVTGHNGGVLPLASLDGVERSQICFE